MLRAAVLVPDTALLVPGAAGRAVVLDEIRAAALEEVRDMVATAPDRVVVVAPGAADRVVAGRVVASLAAAGVDDAALGWRATGGSAPERGADEPMASTATSVALLLLAAAGWSGPTTVVETAVSVETAASSAQALRDRGASLVDGSAPVVLVLAGSLSARHGPDAPLADDPRAATADDALLADLRAADPEARRRLADVPAELARDLAMTVWAPLQVLLGAVGTTPVEPRIAEVAAPWGVPYVVARWVPADGSPEGRLGGGAAAVTT
ncbi:hypothetical protein [Cellulomonas fimi]|uniref:Uncharacterized protein n=1 Tax=Cellulomonas fimi TaxID=1708 RepID=A0A7Y0QGR7_CELFI|nr:hypothetical protein [Cellulomonas fimi]NMR19515.1 hypothetical protein [Cellulomonas fimi]